MASLKQLQSSFARCKLSAVQLDACTSSQIYFSGHSWARNIHMQTVSKIHKAAGWILCVCVCVCVFPGLLLHNNYSTCCDLEQQFYYAHQFWGVGRSKRWQWEWLSLLCSVWGLTWGELKWALLNCWSLESPEGVSTHACGSRCCCQQTTAGPVGRSTF